MLLGGPLGVTWSCNAKANVPRETLKGRPGPAFRAGATRVTRRRW